MSVWLLGGVFWSVCSDIETASGQSRSWVVIDVASHPERPEVLLQSFSADQGQHALVYNGEVLLWNLGSLGQSSGRQERHEMELNQPASDLHEAGFCQLEWMGQQCSGPFTSLAVLDENTLLVVGRRKSGNSRSEVMFLLQPVASEWRCWPLLTEGFEKEGVVLRSFRSVWNASGEESHSGVVRNSCWIWGLCSTATGWQDRRWKLTWNVSVRPIEVQVELTDLHTSGFAIPTELKPFSLEQLHGRGLLKPSVQQDFQKALIPAVGQSRPKQSSGNALAAKAWGDSEPAHLGHVGLGCDDPDHTDDLLVWPRSLLHG